MDVILHQLGELLLKAIPTFLLVILLNIYLKAMFFKPMEKILHQRYEATEGARKMAEESLKRAAEKAAQYEAALRTARAEVYQAQEQIHKELHEEAMARLAAARKQAEATVQQAKQEIAGEVVTARQSLEQQSDALAGQIATSILRRSAA